jgi:hypothetical protein
VNYIGATSLILIALTLVISAVHHLVTWQRFGAEVAAQRTLPPRAVRPTAGLATVVELGLGISLLLIAAGVIGEVGRRIVPLLSAAVFAVYAGYTTFLIRRRPNAPCGCGNAARPVSVWIVLRSLTLCGFSLLTIGSPGIAGTTTIDSMCVTMIATISAITLWISPDALHVPGWRGTADKYAELR